MFYQIVILSVSHNDLRALPHLSNLSSIQNQIKKNACESDLIPQLLFCFSFYNTISYEGPFSRNSPRTYRPENYLTRKRVKEKIFIFFCFVLILRNKLAIQSINAF